ncbi:MAG: F-actin capping protein [Olpidium bornovanus]|uniref:F-actin-capping protein subunit beta n=1 Tax=Olpidium bornovanus TaxID=278681 RepID=A0A8H7ZL77_9FUNG|nr:MAG: F-actin capping protein [Olpidium bornovanus]
MLYMITGGAEVGNITLSGSMTRQAESDYPLDGQSAHVGNLGRLVEDTELRMRNLLEQVYFGKTKDVMNDLRSVRSLAEVQRQTDIQKELMGKLHDRNR